MMVMKQHFKLALLLLLPALWVGFSCSVSAEEPVRLKRSESFLGVHLDFHCNINDKNVGVNTTPKMVNDLLDIVKPDYIQVDCKGHAGITSYPTKVGNHGNSFVGDPLTVWRKVTAQRGVALYMHYSGVWDTTAVTKHPDWATVGPDGKPNGRITSVFGPYTDSLLVPQLLELANEYKVDGAWIDGECWATVPDYNEKVKTAFTKETGIKSIPTKPTDPNWFEWLQFHREGFRKYLRHYLAEVEKKAPQLQVASNWAFTDHMPEPVSADVSFISGDFSHSDSINAARFSTRFMQTQGIGWDLMAWGFSKKDGIKGWVPKTAVQLQREAACVLAQGGGFQAYFTQNRDGSIDLKKILPMGEVAKFCRERQDVCFKSTAVPQVAMVVPVESHYRKVSQAGSSLFPWSLRWQRGMLQALLENHYSVEIYNDKPLLNRLQYYPAVVVCEWETLDKGFVQALAGYVRNGGGLVVIGEKTSHLFDDVFKGASFKECGNAGDHLKMNVATLGRGKVAVIPASLSEAYLKEQKPEVRELVGKAVASVFDKPTVKVDGTPLVDVSLRRTTDGRLAVNLVNCSGPHAKAGIIEKIEPVGPLKISVLTGRKPVKVTLEPGGRSCPFTWQEGQLDLTVEKVAIHDIVVIDDRASNTDWLHKAKYGLFMHFLPGSPERFASINDFDVDAVVKQLEEAGADYFVCTMYQNAGWLNAPNATYDRVTGYKPGEKCSERDLIGDLAKALRAKNIRFIVYITGQTPNADPVAQKAFGLEQGRRDQKIDVTFAKKWAEVFREWSDRYGDLISGWWIDGCYQWIDFNEEIARIYLDALHHGNPNAIVAFNSGVRRPEWITSEYTSGEINDPFAAKATCRWQGGAQVQYLTFVGKRWGQRDIRFTDEQWIDWIKSVNQGGGTITLDMGPNFDKANGPIGIFSPDQMKQLQNIRKAVKK